MRSLPQLRALPKECQKVATSAIVSKTTYYLTSLEREGWSENMGENSLKERIINLIYSDVQSHTCPACQTLAMLWHLMSYFRYLFRDSDVLTGDSDKYDDNTGDGSRVSHNEEYEGGKYKFLVPVS